MFQSTLKLCTLKQVQKVKNNGCPVNSIGVVLLVWQSVWNTEQEQWGCKYLLHNQISVFSYVLHSPLTFEQVKFLHSAKEVLSNLWEFWARPHCTNHLTWPFVIASPGLILCGRFPNVTDSLAPPPQNGGTKADGQFVLCV